MMLNPNSRPVVNGATRTLPTPPDGYRLLERGEVVQAGDYFWRPLRSKGGWWTSCEKLGGIVGERGTALPRCRWAGLPPSQPEKPRKVEVPLRWQQKGPGEGYWLLPPGETILGSDEVWSFTHECWLSCASWGEGFGVGQRLADDMNPRRRKVEPVPTQDPNQLSAVNILCRDYIVPTQVAAHIAELRKALAASLAR